ncbi:hypothetical protein BJV82DRAFT_666536 [Fennellomyces sp. T-0311]|nr:hypothetical protein BJV82DRAFT_666536 [Fennellomyces sp. T-0311]
MAQSAYLHASALTKPGDAFRELSVTALNFTATNDAFEQAKHAYATGDYDQAVKLYTSALEALQTDLTSVIHVHRAAAYEMQDKFEQAAQDGLDANPHNTASQPDPYLTLGSALFLHGQLRESAATYKIGVNVVPKMHPQHGALVKKYQQTLAFIEKQNQLMAQLLPFEVISNILAKLSIKDRARVGMTCRFWNKYIFEKWPYMWETINTFTDLSGYPRRGAGLIDAIRGDQVRNLCAQFDDPEGFYYDLMGYNDEHDSDGDSGERDLGTALIDAMYNGKPSSWKHINNLVLTRCNESQFKKILAVVKSSLHKLTLRDCKQSCHYGERMISMAASEFPNLKMISNHLNTCSQNSWLLNYIRNTAQMSNFHLTSLSISWHLEPALFSDICQCLPALRSLTIDPEKYYNYAHVLDMVIIHFPFLEVLHYATGNVTDKISTTYTLRSSASVNCGLKMLVLYPPDKRVYTADNLTIDTQLDTLCQRGHSTLQALSLNLDLLEGTRYAAIRTLTQLGAPNLHVISLYAHRGSSIMPQIIGSLLSFCPSLDTIKIDGLSIGHVNNILDAMVVSRPIQRLYIYFYVSPRCDMSINSMASFFERTQHVYEFSLNDCIDDNFTPTDQFAFGLTRAIGSSTVRELNLRTFKMTNEQLIGSLKNLRNSHIRTLRIRVASLTDETVLDALADIQHLTHLILYDHHHGVNENDLCRLFGKWEQPQMLVVEVQFKNPQGYIKGYIPDLATMRPKKDQIADPRLRYSIVKV